MYGPKKLQLSYEGLNSNSRACFWGEEPPVLATPQPTQLRSLTSLLNIIQPFPYSRIVPSQATSYSAILSGYLPIKNL